MSARLAFATHNPHKVHEVWAILSPHVPALAREHLTDSVTLGLPAPPETGVTFQENALIKAHSLAAATGLPAIADDSGIAVDVLGGAPGVFSARWSGRGGDDDANVRLLLEQMSDVPEEHRGGAFVCAAALVYPDGREEVELGYMHGRLTYDPVGRNGFGYDPIFVAAGQEVTNAQLDPEIKNGLSHRGRAFRALAPYVREALGQRDVPPEAR